MNHVSSFQPKWVSAPGDTINDILKAKNISVSDFAAMMNSNIEQIKKLLYGKVSITEETAIKLKDVLGSSTEFWINRERRYRESIQRLRVDEEAKWVNELPIKDMIRLGWINKTNNIVKECLNFFNVPDVWCWRKEYNDVAAVTAFRKTEASQSKFGAISSWLRAAEIQSNKIKCEDWNAELFQKSLQNIRALVKKKDPKEFIPELRNICAKSGVAVIILRTPNGCPASGATKFISSNKAMILLSFRYLSDDQFWFTFFHEAGHLLLHGDKVLFIEEENITSKEEDEANKFSEDILIPVQFQQRLKSMSSNQMEIKRLAKDADISLGVIVGQLQHIGKLNIRYLNGFKRRYELRDIMEASQ